MENGSIPPPRDEAGTVSVVTVEKYDVKSSVTVTGAVSATTSSRTPAGPGDEGLSSFEGLAASIKTSEADDSLAISSSLLQEEDLTLHHRRWPWILAWPVMTLVAALISMIVLPYQLLAVRAGAERRLLGPRWLSRLLGRIIHPLVERTREGVTTSAALDVIYAMRPLLRAGRLRGVGGRLVEFMLRQPDGQAVSNRLIITYRALQEHLDLLYRAGERHIRMVSLACGSAHASVEAVAWFLKTYPGASIELHLVDLSEPSLRRAARLAQIRGVADHVTVHHKNLKTFLAEQSDGFWHVVEMVGFLDYRTKNSVRSLCGGVRRILRHGGLFIGAHIAPSPWAFVVRWAVNWPLLLRRAPEEYKRLLIQSGWQAAETQMRVEPHRIHAVSVCVKSHDAQLDKSASA